MPVNAAYILGVLSALAATVLAFIFFLPEKKKANLPDGLKKIVDILDFRTLFLEKIVKAIYLFLTFACICIGLFMLISVNYGYYSDYWMGGRGLLLMILGPVAIRIVFEITMLFILLVQNVIEINKKLSAKAEPTEEPESVSVEPEYRFCTHCGTRYDINTGGCPNCDKN